MRRSFILVVVAAWGCSHAEHLSEQQAVAASQIERWVGRGTPVADARRIMEGHGFTCSIVTNGSFGDLQGADYLYCDHSSGAAVRRRWQAALLLADQKVADIRVTTGLVGP